MPETIQFNKVADLYDYYVNVDFDIDFFMQESKNTKGKVLELTSGTGRISIPLLKKGISVICTRYILSTLAYGNLEIKDEKWLIEINKKFILPDMTIFLKVSPKICIQRMKKERFHKELFEKEDKLKKVLKNYLKFASRFDNVYIINGERSIKEVSEDVKNIEPVRSLWQKKIL